MSYNIMLTLLMLHRWDLFFNTSLARFLRFRRRMKSVCHALTGTKNHGFIEERWAALWSRWRAVTRQSRSHPLTQALDVLDPLTSMVFSSGNGCTVMHYSLLFCSSFKWYKDGRYLGFKLGPIGSVRILVPPS